MRFGLGFRCCGRRLIKTSGGSECVGWRGSIRRRSSWRVCRWCIGWCGCVEMVYLQWIDGLNIVFVILGWRLRFGLMWNAMWVLLVERFQWHIQKLNFLFLVGHLIKLLWAVANNGLRFLSVKLRCSLNQRLGLRSAICVVLLDKRRWLGQLKLLL